MAAKKKPQGAASENEAPQGAAPQPEATEPTEQQAAQADAPQPEATEPEATEPAATEPEATEQQAAQPDAPQPEAAEPQEAPEVEAPAAVAAQEDLAVTEEPVDSPQPTTARADEPPTGEQPPAEVEAGMSARASDSDEAEGAEEAAEPAPRAKPSVPGAHLEVDIVPEGVDPLGRGEEEYEDRYAIEEEDLAPAGAEQLEEEPEEVLSQPIASAAIDLAAGARYRATGKRKTAIARVTLRPGSGTYLVNGRTLEEHFPRLTLQRNIRQPLETVGYQERMDVVARLHGGGISAQAGALRHGVSRALLEADPNLRGELKRRGFLTRDSRAKERKKAGLKKARKRPQFSKR
jgi:small subunit ribosomal protein S9